MVTPTANTTSRQQFEERGAEIRTLRAKPSLEKMDAQSSSQYAEQCIQNALQKDALQKETLVAAGSTANVAMKTLLLVAARDAAAKKFAKTLTKEVAKQVTDEVAKEAAKKASEKASEKFLKIVPFVGCVFGVCLAVGRGIKGDHWTLIAGELVSGGASCFPGVGQAISLVIDAGLLATDVYRAHTINQSMSTPEFEAVIDSLVEAYGCIGITYVEGGDKPSKKIVDDSYHLMLLQYHPDKASDQSKVIQKSYTRFTKLINGSKDMIYKIRGW